VGKKTYIFDTSAFIKGMDVSVLQEYTCYTTPGVLSEIKNKFVKQKLETAILTGNLKILSPDPESIKKVKLVAKSSGDLQFLSTTDIGIIALALTVQTMISEKETTLPKNLIIEVVTDDYSMQNVLSRLPISTNSFVQKGINQFIQWQIYCPQCKTIYPPTDTSFCPKCEVKLKRRPNEKK
jgi:rRNA maturation endonuclease Nob1